MCLYFLHASSCRSVPTQGTHGHALWEYSQKDSASGWGRESHGFFCALGFWGTITTMPTHFCYAIVRPKVCVGTCEILHLVVGKPVLNSNEIPHYAKWASQPCPLHRSFLQPHTAPLSLPDPCKWSYRMVFSPHTHMKTPGLSPAQPFPSLTWHPQLNILSAPQIQHPSSQTHIAFSHLLYWYHHSPNHSSVKPESHPTLFPLLHYHTLTPTPTTYTHTANQPPTLSWFSPPFSIPLASSLNNVPTILGPCQNLLTLLPALSWPLKISIPSVARVIFLKCRPDPITSLPWRFIFSHSQME